MKKVFTQLVLAASLILIGCTDELVTSDTSQYARYYIDEETRLFLSDKSE